MNALTNPEQAVVCDIGGVLTPPPVQAVAEYLKGSGLSLDEVAAAVGAYARRRDRNPLEELELGHIDGRRFLSMIAEAIGIGDEKHARLDGFTAHYFSQLELNQRLLSHLRRLADQRVRLAILSNNARDWHKRWRAMPELSIFEVFVNSALEGVRKPDPAIYRITAERLALPPGCCVFLDDLALNCDAARGVGMRAIHYTGTDAAIRALDAELGRQGA